MNMFFSVVSDEVKLGVANRLIEHYKPKECYITHSKTSDYKKIVGCTVAEAYSSIDIRYTGDYDGYIHEKDCQPIDKSLLDKMSQHESTIIKMLERKYVRIEPNRKTPSYEERVRVYHKHLRYWSHLLDVAQIKIAVFIRIPHEVYDYVIYCLCKIKGITVATAREGPIRGFTYFMSDAFDYYPGFQTIYERYSEELSDTPVDDISLPDGLNQLYEAYTDRQKDKTPYYVRSLKLKTLTAGRVFFKMLARLFWSIIRKHFARQLKQNKHDIKNYFSQRKLYKIYTRLSIIPDLTKRYIYFPLQFQPELSTSPVGGVFVNQMLAIKMLSFYLPDDVFIYVKEHPMQDSYCRKEQFYHDLSKLPNVKLVAESINSYKLIENCVAVSSITGLAGFEGLFIDKPFIMFGSAISMYAPGTFRVRNNEDCQKALDHILKHGAKHTIRDMKIFMKVCGDYVKCCEYGRKNDFKSLGIPQYSVEENIQRHYEGYAKVLDEQLNFVGE